MCLIIIFNLYEFIGFFSILRKKSSSKSTKPTNSINKKVQIQFALLRDLIVVIFFFYVGEKLERL